MGAGPSSRRDRLRAQMSADVRSVARDIIGRHGVEALTLAAVAREVGVTPAALYRYFTGLPDIVRQAARDIVGDLCRELREVAEAEAETDFAARLVEPARAFRRWSLAHRQEFGLLFGTPAPAAGGAHGEVTGERVRRLAGVWGPVFTQLWAARPYPIPAEEELDPALRRQLSDHRRVAGVELPLGALVVVLSCWRSLYGQVALEVFDHFAPLITDQEPMFELLMQDLTARTGLAAEYRPPRADADH
ncbi:TetR/AcrR family transcriptional regulator [Kitasatospora griseola]|uniref:TetR/AcrR family transcriptional regulator n=1 Tax=Kitasatospora griseola TaxID=2064 RepID=UPI003828A51D